MHLQLAASALLALFMVAFTTALHHHALLALSDASEGRTLSRAGVIVFLVALVGAHLCEIALYAGAYVLGAGVFHLGALHGPSGIAALDVFYFAAETYSTLGYGDIVPVGALRLLASVESLNGLLLLAWSGAFLYGVLDESSRPGRGRRR